MGKIEKILLLNPSNTMPSDSARRITTPLGLIYVGGSLRKNGYDVKRLFSLSEYYDRERPKYYDAIQSVRENKLDMTSWLEYFTGGLRDQLITVKIKGEKVIKREVLIEKAKKFNLNDRQKNILLYLLEEKRASVEEIRQRYNFVRRTVQRDLLKLVNLGLIKEIARSKTDPTRYYELP